MTRNQNHPVKVPLVTEVWGIWKSLQVARRNVLEIIPEAATTEPIITGKTGIRWHMLMQPKAIGEVLKDRLDQYPKSNTTKNILRPAVGESLFIAEGAHWRWQRRAVTPVFKHRNIANLAPIMTHAAERTCKRLQDTSSAVDMFEQMVETTFDIISDVTFSGDGTMDSDAVHQAIDRYIEETAKVSILDILGLPDWFPRPSRFFPPKSLRDMKALADKAIEKRKLSGPRDVPDLLDLLLEGEDPDTKRQMNTGELRDNLLTFIVAGHETTALTLAWAIYLCAFDQNVQNKLRDEVTSVLNGRAATADDVPNMPYTEQVIKEALRLYPPAAFLSRTAQTEDTLVDRDIHKGDTVMLPIYALHRHKDLWDDPDAFDPDRFENGFRPERYSYLPFGDGPRVCIGMQFALMEAVIILSTLISRFRFTAIKGKDPKPVMVLTLRPEGGVWMDVQPV